MIQNNQCLAKLWTELVYRAQQLNSSIPSLGHGFFFAVSVGIRWWGRRGQRLLLMFLISHLLSGSTIWRRMEHIKEREMDGTFSLKLPVEVRESEFSAGSLSLAGEVAFMIANGNETVFLNQICRLLDFFFWLFLIWWVGLTNATNVFCDVSTLFSYSAQKYAR